MPILYIYLRNGGFRNLRTTMNQSKFIIFLQPGVCLVTSFTIGSHYERPYLRTRYCLKLQIQL